MAFCGKRVSGVVLIAAALAAIGSARQEPKQPTTDPKPATGKNVVLVRGCLTGTTLTNTKPRDYVLVIPETLRTTGNRAMRAQMKELNGHLVEMTGVLKGLTNNAMGALVKDTGKTKIYVGGTDHRTAEESFRDQQRIEPPTLDVTSIKDINESCMDDEKSN